MTVYVVSVYAGEKNGNGDELYSVQLTVDGKMHMLQLVREGKDSGIETLQYTSDLYWDLFAQDHFYITAVPRLVRDIIAGYQPSFPMRFEEVGSGSRYRKG